MLCFTYDVINDKKKIIVINQALNFLPFIEIYEAIQLN